MKLSLDRHQVLALADRFEQLAPLVEQLRFGPRIEIPHRLLPLEALAHLVDLGERARVARGTAVGRGGEAFPGTACANEEGTADGGLGAVAPEAANQTPFDAGRHAQLQTLLTALQEPSTRFDASDDLEMLLPAIARWLIQGGERGWLFHANLAGKPLAWVVTRLDFVAPSSEETGKVMIELKAHAKLGLVTQTMRITEADMIGRSVAEIFADKGFLKETPALLAQYDRTAQRYFDWRTRDGVQFLGTGTGFHAEDPSATHRDSDWTRKDQVVMSSGGGAARLVNDEGILPARAGGLDAPGDILGPYLRKAAKSNRYSAESEVAEQQADIPKGLFTQLPVHGYLFMFHLDLHHHVWVHVDDLTVYAYQPELKGKLVLPPEQTDLIDILTAEMDVLMDDIVAGKSGGTTVLCAGPPGVGKTLTAEVYAEIIGRPLYRVHSGQLGLNVASMETALKDALTRAQRWGAVMLIDEADVYIKKRDDNITMNAVVGVFLRVLEYFNGLLFLTTNRIDDIDEAIVSRCIALIRYHAPDEAARARIWGVMAAQFGLVLDDVLISTLARRFAQASGRDIKGLAKLVAKYCHHQKAEPTMAVFLRCAIFRGLDALPV